VDGAERAVAILHGVDDDAKPEDVGELLEGQRLGFHLAEYRPRLLLAALHLGLDAILFEQARQRRLDLAEHAAILLEYPGQPLGDGPVGFGVDIAEGKVFQFLAHALHAHAPGQRRIDVHGLLGDALPGLVGHVVERTHVVETVGELDQKDPHILGYRQKQLAQIFSLHRLLRNQVELLELGQAFDQLAHVGPEQLVDLLPGGGGVLDRIVQQRHGDRRFVHMHVGEDRRDLERVREIRVPRGALLVPMFLHRIDVGAVEQRLVHVGLVALHALDKLILPHHWAGSK
jgi:hypothetical protein